jgi:hypothetical protein
MGFGPPDGDDVLVFFRVAERQFIAEMFQFIQELSYGNWYERVIITRDYLIGIKMVTTPVGFFKDRL